MLSVQRNGMALALAAVIVAGAWVYARGLRQVAADLVGGAADVAAGAVEGIGDAVGVPRTSAQQCELDIAAGRVWDASFSCPAGQFLEWWMSK